MSKKQNPLDGVKLTKAASMAFDAAPAAVEEPRDVALSPLAPDFKQYRVVKTKSVIWGNRGQMIKLGEGDIVSDATHGASTAVKMRDAGVELEEVS